MTIPGMPEGVEDDKVTASMHKASLAHRLNLLKQEAELCGLKLDFTLRDPVEDAVGTDGTVPVKKVLASAATRLMSLADQLGYHVRIEHAKNPLKPADVTRTIDFWPMRPEHEGDVSLATTHVRVFPSYN